MLIANQNQTDGKVLKRIGEYANNL